MVIKLVELIWDSKAISLDFLIMYKQKTNQNNLLSKLNN
jgi:hypothetical protein